MKIKWDLFSLYLSKAHGQISESTDKQNKDLEYRYINYDHFVLLLNMPY